MKKLIFILLTVFFVLVCSLTSQYHLPTPYSVTNTGSVAVAWRTNEAVGVLQPGDTQYTSVLSGTTDVVFQYTTNFTVPIVNKIPDDNSWIATGMLGTKTVDVTKTPVVQIP